MRKTKIFEGVPNAYLGLDTAIERASNVARGAINLYRNSEDLSAEGKFVNLISEHRQTTNYEDDIDDTRFIPPQRMIATMNENIVKYLNRSSQHLRSKIFEEIPTPRTRKQFFEFSMELSDSGQYRKLDTMLFASNMIMLTNNLDTNLFKQVASTIYGKYDIETDKITMSVGTLKDRLMPEHRTIYESLFENGLEEFKGILMPLRNTAGHSDIGQKIFLDHTDNPKIMYQGEKQDAYPIIQRIALAYLLKTNKVYDALAAAIRYSGPNPHIEDFMRKQVKKYCHTTAHRVESVQ